MKELIERIEKLEQAVKILEGHRVLQEHIRKTEKENAVHNANAILKGKGKKNGNNA